MEQTKEHSAVKAEDATPERPSAFGAKKVERIAQQSKGLIDDVKDWIDLKITLVELEIREKVKARQEDAITYALVGFLAVLALVFLLITVALGLGAWLGHPAWGFLIVTGILAGVAGLLYALHTSRRKKDTLEGKPDPKTLTASEDQKQLPPGSSKDSHHTTDGENKGEGTAHHRGR